MNNKLMVLIEIVVIAALLATGLLSCQAAQKASKDVEALKVSITKLNEDNVAISDKLDVLAGKIDTQGVKVSSIKTAVDGIAPQVSTINTQISSVNTQMGKITDNSSSIAGINASMANTRSSIDNLTASITNLSVTDKTILDQIAILRTQVDTISISSDTNTDTDTDTVVDGLLIGNNTTLKANDDPEFNGGYYYTAQTFSLTKDAILDYVKVYITVLGNSGTSTWSIRKLNPNGWPSSISLKTKSTTFTGKGWKKIDFPGTYMLYANTAYALVKQTEDSDANNYSQWGQTANTFAKGKYFYSTDGATWSVVDPTDYLFELYGEWD